MQNSAAMLRHWQHGDLQIQSKSHPRDLVTRADKESERILIEAIRESFPQDAILAEESGEVTDGHSEVNPASASDNNQSTDDNAQYRWVLDPLDGTVNYAHGSPQYAISAGIMRGEDCVAGAILHPVTGHLYTAITGQGAYKDGARISVSSRSPMNNCLAVTGFPYRRAEFMDTLLQGIRLILENARGLRRTGACCVDLTWLAEGIFDAHYEFFLSPWDTAAATCIVREAGGKVTSLEGKPYVPGMPLLLASNGLIHDELLQAMRPLQSSVPNQIL